jgi:N-acetylneuraminic acid mutarotase
MQELRIDRDDWRALPDMPVEKWEAATFLLDEKIHIFGGYTTRVKSSRICHVFDPATTTWTRMQDLPSAISHVNAVLDGRRVWFAGGFKDGYKDHIIAEVWNYDFDLDRFTAAPLLPQKRGGGGLALFGRRLHFVGGLKADRDTDAGDHWVLDLDEYDRGTAQWRAEAAPMPIPRNQFSTIVFDGRMFLIGGQFHHDSAQLDQAMVDIYDPVADTWSSGPDLPKGHSHSEGGTFVHAGRIYMVGGHTTPKGGRKAIDPDILALTPGASAWELVGKLPLPLSSPAARIVDGKFYVAGGSLDGRSVQPKMWVADAP